MHTSGALYCRIGAGRQSEQVTLQLPGRRRGAAATVFKSQNKQADLAQGQQAVANVSQPAAKATPPARPNANAEKGKDLVPPPARPARARRRHWFLLLSFLVLAVTPVLVTSFYLWTAAADQYASRLAFSVRSEEQSSPIEILGGITDLSGSSSSDTDILYAYLNSQELVSRIDDKVDLGAIWGRISPSEDPVFAYDIDGTIEDLVAHWKRKVSIIYDSSTRLIEMRILAFEPKDAMVIAQSVLDESTEMINQLSAIAREDAIRYAREDLQSALVRLRVARQELTRFRNRTQIVDPSIDTQNQMGLLITLQQQLADAFISVDLLLDTTGPEDPRLIQAQRRVEVIEARIKIERQKLGLGGDEEGAIVYADLVGEYEGLIVDREFAETSYTATLAAFDAAQAEARRQSRYLAAHVRPTLAQRAEYPKRLNLTVIVGIFSLLGWAIFCLVFYSLRDRT